MTPSKSNAIAAGQLDISGTIAVASRGNKLSCNTGFQPVPLVDVKGAGWKPVLQKNSDFDYRATLIWAADLSTSTPPLAWQPKVVQASVIRANDSSANFMMNSPCPRVGGAE